MKMKELFKGKTCIAKYDDDKQRVYFTFNGYAIVEEHKEMYTQVMEYISANRTTAGIFDFREMQGTFTGLNAWVIEKLKPALKNGYKRTALVLNEDIFTLFAANDAVKQITMIEVQIFRNTEDAEIWCDR